MFGKNGVVAGWGILMPDTGRHKVLRKKDRNWDQVLPERQSRLEGEYDMGGSKEWDHGEGVDETSRSYKGRSAVTPSFSPSLVSFIAPALRNLDDGGEGGSGLRPYTDPGSRGNTPSSHEHDGYTPEFSRWSDSDSDSDSERRSGTVSFESTTLSYHGHSRTSASWGHAPRRHGNGKGAAAGGRDGSAPSRDLGRHASYGGTPVVGLGISSMSSSADSASGGESPPLPHGPRLASAYSSAASSFGRRRVVPRGPRPQYVPQREAAYASPASASESSATDSSFRTATDHGAYVMDDDTDDDRDDGDDDDQDNDQDKDATDGFLGVSVAHVEHVGAAVPEPAPLASHGSFGPEQSLVAVDPAASLTVPPAADDADEDVRSNASLTFGRRGGRAHAGNLARMREVLDDDAPGRAGQHPGAGDLWPATTTAATTETTPATTTGTAPAATHDACDVTPTLATVGRMATLAVSDADALAELSEFESTPPPVYTPRLLDPLVNITAHGAVQMDVAPSGSVSSPPLFVTPTLSPSRDMDMAPSEPMRFAPPLVPDESGLALHATPPATADTSPVDPGAATLPPSDRADVETEEPGSGHSTPCMTHSPHSDPRSHLESPPSPATFGATYLVETPRKPARQTLAPLDAHGDERPAPFARHSFGCGESDDEAGETRRWASRMSSVSASVTPRPSDVGTIETLEFDEFDDDDDVFDLTSLDDDDDDDDIVDLTSVNSSSALTDIDEDTVYGHVERGGPWDDGDRARAHFFASLHAQRSRSFLTSASGAHTEDARGAESVPAAAAAAMAGDGDGLYCAVTAPTDGANGAAVLPQLGARRSFTSLSSLGSEPDLPAVPEAVAKVQRRRSFAHLMRIREDRPVDLADADDTNPDHADANADGTGPRRRKVRQRGVGLRRTVLNPPEPAEDETFSVDRPPSQRRLWEAGTCFVYDENGRAVCFGDLFPRAPLGDDGLPLPRAPGDGPEPKTIVFFIRTFWCGQCQDYMLASIARLDPYVLAAHNVRVVVIAPGNWKMLKAYRRVTKCPFEIYTDAPRRLYMLMGMILPINFFRFNGERPGYHQSVYPKQSYLGIYRAFRHMPIGNAGNIFQLGGEFIFSPGYKCDFAHRMMYMGDHMEAHEVLRRAGVDHAAATPQPVSEGERAAREQLDREAREASQWREERARELERMRRKKAARRGVDYDDTWTAGKLREAEGGEGEGSAVDESESGEGVREQGGDEDEEKVEAERRQRLERETERERGGPSREVVAA